MDKFGMYRKIAGTKHTDRGGADYTNPPGGNKGGADDNNTGRDITGNNKRKPVPDRCEPAPPDFPEAQTYGGPPPEGRPREPGAEKSSVNNYAQKTAVKTESLKNAASYALRAFVENQERHERLSKQIDERYGKKD